MWRNQASPVRINRLHMRPAHHEHHRPKSCNIADHRLFNLIFWVLYTGMPWKCVPMPKGPTGKPELHYTNVYKAFARGADDGSLQQAFIASVGHLSDEKHLDLRVLHGDGTNTVAKKGAMGSATRAISTKKGRRSSPLRITMAMCCPPSPWLLSMRRT